MKVKSQIVARYEDKGRLKAVATVCLDGKFLVTGVRVADCQKGLAVFMPSLEIHAGDQSVQGSACRDVTDGDPWNEVNEGPRTG